MTTLTPVGSAPAPAAQKPRVLCVDDDPAALEGFALHLRRRCRAEMFTSPHQALHALTNDGPFAAIISDMRMPGMDGTELLARARAASPDTVRLLLTGHADIEVALAAVNDGGVFRFLTKPCPAESLVRALDAALEQYRLISTERVLLGQTLTGAVAALCDLAALANPAAFGRASRVHRLVTALCARRKVKDLWPIEVAARLSQVGAIQLSPAAAEKLYSGKPLDEAEQALADKGPGLADQLLARIPRLEPVREILAAQAEPYNRPGGPPPLGARLLRLAGDFDALEAAGLSSTEALGALATRTGQYDLDLVAALREEVQERAALVLREVPLALVKPGMVLATDLRSRAGVLLVARGHAVSPTLLAKLQSMSASLPAAITVVAPRSELTAVEGGAR